MIAVGAILRWGVTLSTQGIDLHAIGAILMVVGLIGAIVSIAFLMSWSPWPYRDRTRTVVRDYPADHEHVDVVERRTIR
jgi:hypothetical protein